MKKTLLGAFALLAAFAVSAGLGAATAQAEPVTIEVVATGDEEVPPVDDSGRAHARFTFDSDTNELTYVVTVSGPSPGLVTAAHIHRGVEGENGPVVYPLSLEGFTIVSGSITLTDDDVADLEAGRFYVNVHSMEHPGGFARAQLFLPESAAPDPEPEAPITPPDTGDGGLADPSGGAVLPLAGLALLIIVSGWRLAAVRASS